MSKLLVGTKSSTGGYKNTNCTILYEVEVGTDQLWGYRRIRERSRAMSSFTNIGSYLEIATITNEVHSIHMVMQQFTNHNNNWRAQWKKGQVFWKVKGQESVFAG